MGRKRADLLSGIFWLLCAVGLCYRAAQLGIGRVSEPGPGFLIFLAAAFLGLFSVLLVLSSLWLTRKEPEREPEAMRWDKVGLILLFLIAYGFVLPKIGFVLSTFLLVGVILRWIERKKWHVALLCGAGAAVGTYALFELWLQARLPRGFWGF